LGGLLFVITVDVGAAFFFVDSELGAVASGIDMLKLSPQFILFPAVPMS
jgi:hypothetical protein